MKISRFVLVACCLLPGLVFAAPGLPEASQLFRQGQHAQALDKVNGFLASNAKDPQGRFLKGIILAELNRTQEAIGIFNALTEDYPELPEPYNNLAVLYASLGQYDRAKTSLEKAIRTHPSYATAHENLGDIYAKMASLAYNKALQLDKGNASAQMKLALVTDIFNPAGVEKAKPATKPGPVKAASMSQDTAAKPTESAPAESKPAPAKTVKPAKQAAGGASTPEQLVKEWAAAWSRGDVPTYLSFYGGNFETPRNMSRENWEAQRNERLTNPEYIEVTVTDLDVSGDADKATATFRQRYVSNLLKSTMRKTLTLEKQGGAWKIVSER